MIRINNLNISLDRKEEGSDFDFISHAHSDHIMAAKSSKSVIASDETSDLIYSGYKIGINRAAYPDFIRLIDSGHMLGAKQIAIEDYDSGNKIIYSGDYLMAKSKASNPIKVEGCDILIIDSTYPSEQFVFRDREEVEYEIQEWVERTVRKGIILFGVYPMGKAQEIIKILNEIGIKPAVNRKISAISKVYNKYGQNLDYGSIYEGDEDLFDGDFVGIIGTRSLKKVKHMLSYLHHKPVYTAETTGFSKVFSLSVEKQFELSDHSDFKQALRYIDSADPKKIYTYGENSHIFSANLKKLGYNSEPFQSLKKLGNATSL